MKRKILLFALLLILAAEALLPAFAAVNRVSDPAGLLTRAETDELNQTIERLANRYGCEIELLIDNRLPEKTMTARSSVQDAAKKLKSKSDVGGIAILLDYSKTEPDILSSGYGDFYAVGLSMNRWDILQATGAKSLSKDPAVTARLVLSQLSERLEEEYPSYLSRFKNMLPLAAFIGLIVAIIWTVVLVKKLKIAKYQSSASAYVRQGSLNMQVARDIYLYSTVTRRKIERDTKR